MGYVTRCSGELLEAVQRESDVRRFDGSLPTETLYYSARYLFLGADGVVAASNDAFLEGTTAVSNGVFVKRCSELRPKIREYEVTRSQTVTIPARSEEEARRECLGRLWCVATTKIKVQECPQK